MTSQPCLKHMRNNFTFKDPSSLSKWLKFFLYLCLFLNVVSLVSDLIEHQFLQEVVKEVFTSEEELGIEAELNDKRQFVICIINFLSLLMMYVLFYTWIYRINKNAHALNAKEMQHSPAMSVIWFFVPFFSIWKSYQIMQEIWKSSTNPTNWKSVASSTLVKFWWVFWTIDGFVSMRCFKSYLKAETIPELIKVNYFAICNDLSSIPVNTLIILLVSNILRKQLYPKKILEVKEFD